MGFHIVALVYQRLQHSQVGAVPAVAVAAVEKLPTPVTDPVKARARIRGTREERWLMVKSHGLDLNLECFGASYPYKVREAEFQ